MAYVGSYSYTGKAKGITVYDVDVETGKFIYRCEVEVDNSSYLKASQNGQILYSIADEGVVAFRVLPNGSLARLNSANIRGMRGCHLSTSKADDYIFISGFHDGKITVLNLNKDGTVGQIADGVFHKGLGSVAERSFRPHVSCSCLSPALLQNKCFSSGERCIAQAAVSWFGLLPVEGIVWIFSTIGTRSPSL